MTSPSYPAALDALANPGPTTETDDAGFELDLVIARLQNIAMAIEGKLGVGVGGPPAADAVLRRTATGASAWGKVATADLAANAVSQVIFKSANAGFSAGLAWAGDVGAGGLIQAITPTGGPILVTVMASMYLTGTPGVGLGRISIFREDLGTPLISIPEYFAVKDQAHLMACQYLDATATVGATYRYLLAAQSNDSGNTLTWMPDGFRSMVLKEIKR